MATLRAGTFNLFQFVAPPYSWYEKKNSFSKKQWQEKTSWIKSHIKEMDCDIIGFQEVFSKDVLKDMMKELNFDYFITVDDAKLDKDYDTVFISTTVALASKYPILEIQKVAVHKESILTHNFEEPFEFSRIPLKALIELPNKKKISVYVNHFKSNRLNELEYTFTKEHTLAEKKEKTKDALAKNISKALKQRLCETSCLFYDFKNRNTPIISLCDLNDKEYSLSIESLTNEAYHENKEENSYLLYDAYDLETKKIYNPHPEQKEKVKEPTSYFQGRGNILDYIFVSKHFKGKINSYELFNKHFHNNPHGSLLQSDHAQVVCEIKLD